MQQRMKAIAIEGGQGPAEALRLIERDVPEPRSGEILIRVRAAGVNRPDLLQRMGKYPPPPGAPDTLGLEVAGDVERGAGRIREGDRVCALLGGGGYAEYATVDARHALPIPRGLDYVQAAALPETVFTVFTNMFEDGALKAGETLLLHGATSGIGVAAIQMARAAGARVIATARGAAKATAARELGADIAVDSTVEDFSRVARDNGGIDVALDMVGAPVFAGTLEALNYGGRIVYVAALGGEVTELPIRKLMAKRGTIRGSTLRPRSADEKARLAREIEHIVWPWIEAGKLRAIVDRVFPLAEAAQAHAHLERGQHTGKIVLTVD
jgi:NADPH:quinone reductase